MLETTAIILCGGKGERLRPLTHDLPKALVPINGQPILYHILKYLSGSGIRRFVLCVGYKAEAIEQFVAEYASPEWHIRCVNSGDASMTDRVLDAAAADGASGPALLCYGDTLANVDLTALEECHRSASTLATITVYPLRSAFGIVTFDQAGLVTRMEEKPLLPYWINIGYMLCDPGALARMRPGSNLVEFCNDLCQSGSLAAYQHLGQHVTVNTEKDLMEAQAMMVDFATVVNWCD